MKEKADRLQMIHNSEIKLSGSCQHRKCFLPTAAAPLQNKSLRGQSHLAFSDHHIYQLKAKLSGRRGGNERALQRLSFVSVLGFFVVFLETVPGATALLLVSSKKQKSWFFVASNKQANSGRQPELSVQSAESKTFESRSPRRRRAKAQKSSGNVLYHFNFIFIIAMEK